MVAMPTEVPVTNPLPSTIAIIGFKLEYVTLPGIDISLRRYVAILSDIVLPSRTVPTVVVNSNAPSAAEQIHILSIATL